MNRQRNRRQRDGHKSNAGSPATPQQAAGTVPTAEQVVPGAAVFIVLEEDQPSGRETPGTVQHVLTRGNHPRGIKVRLHGGMVGRVQRMGGGAGGASAAGPERAGVTAGGARPVWTDVRLGGYPAEPPARTLADFMPAFGDGTRIDGLETGAPRGTITCPVCDAFHGDEAAVTHHVERHHFS